MAVNTTLVIGTTLGVLAFLITGVVVLICVKKRRCICCRSQTQDNTHSKTPAGQVICDLEAGNSKQELTKSGSTSSSTGPGSDNTNSQTLKEQEICELEAGNLKQNVTQSQKDYKSESTSRSTGPESDNTHSQTPGGQEICEHEAGNIKQNVTQFQKKNKSESTSSSTGPESDNTNSQTPGGQEICEHEAGNIKQNVTQFQKQYKSTSATSTSLTRTTRPESGQNICKKAVRNIQGIQGTGQIVPNQGYGVFLPSNKETSKRNSDTQKAHYKAHNKLNQKFHGLNIDGKHRKKRQPKVHYYKPGWTEVTAKQAMNLARDVFVKNWDSSRKTLKNPKRNLEASGTNPFNTGSKPSFVKVGEDDTRGWATKDSLQGQWKNMSHYSFNIPNSYKFRASESTSNPNQINLKIARPYRKDNFQSFYNYHLNCFYPSQLEHEYI